METEDFEFEELVIAEAIGLAFHGLDLVVGALQGAGGDRVVVVGQDALAVFGQGVGELLQDRNARGLGAANPVVQHPASGRLVRLPPDLPQVLLEVVGHGQRRVQSQGVLQALLLVAARIEVLRVLQQEPARALEDLALLRIRQLPIQLAAQGAELVVEQLDDVEVVEHVDRTRQMLAHRPDVGPAHVGGHGLHLGMGRPQPPPERGQGLDALAIADEDHGPAVQVEHHREVAVPLADGDLVDGDLPEVLQLGLAETPLQMPLLDVLDDVPTDAEVPGHILDGRELGQLQGIALEGVRVGPPRIGERNLDLPGVLAAEADDARHLDQQVGRLQADGNGLQETLLVSLAMDRRRTAIRAAVAFPGLLDGEAHPALEKLGSTILVATKTERVVQ